MFWASLSKIAFSSIIFISLLLLTNLSYSEPLGKEIKVDNYDHALSEEICCDDSTKKFSSRIRRSKVELNYLPLRNSSEIISLSPGQIGNLANRGYWSGLNYFVNGTSFLNPLTRESQLFLPLALFDSIEISNGDWPIEYGNALNGLVDYHSVRSRDKFTGLIDFKSGGAVQSSAGHFEEGKDIQAMFAGPLFLIPERFGKVDFVSSLQLLETNGRFANDDSTLSNIFSEINYSPSPSTRISINGHISNSEFSRYDHRWSRTIDEDNQLRYVDDPFFADWVGNGIVDSEDENGNGLLDPSEDLNGNYWLDSEDLNHNNSLDKFNMLDHTPEYENHTDHIAFLLEQDFGDDFRLTLQASRFKTSLKWNVNETTNEDANGNGFLDLEHIYLTPADIPDSIQASYSEYLYYSSEGYFITDFNQNGLYDYEDLNGNGIWDWDYYGPDKDLFRDDNNNGYIDASELGDSENWLPWEQTRVSGNSQDANTYYTYGNGKTFSRDRWHDDYTIDRTYNLNLIYSGLKHQKITAGVENKNVEIFVQDVEMASGGNVYSENYNTDNSLNSVWFNYQIYSRDGVLDLGFKQTTYSQDWKISGQEDPIFDPGFGGSSNNPVETEKTHLLPSVRLVLPLGKRIVLAANWSKQVIVDSEELTILSSMAEIALHQSLKLKTRYFSSQYPSTSTSFTWINGRNHFGFRSGGPEILSTGYVIELEKELTSFFAWNLNYTSSNSVSRLESRVDYDNQWGGYALGPGEIPANWDRKTSFNGTLIIHTPHGSRPFGKFWLEGWTIGMIGRYGSGLPFSTPARDRDPVINDQRLGSTTRFDLKVQYDINVLGKAKLGIYVQAFNLFDHRNIDQLYFQSNGDIDWYLFQDSDGDGIEDYDVDGRLDDPRFWQQGRVYQMGLRIQF